MQQMRMRKISWRMTENATIHPQNILTLHSLTALYSQRLMFSAACVKQQNCLSLLPIAVF
jgi:hypothetical protein